MVSTARLGHARCFQACGEAGEVGGGGGHQGESRGLASHTLQDTPAGPLLPGGHASQRLQHLPQRHRGDQASKPWPSGGPNLMGPEVILLFFM